MAKSIVTLVVNNDLVQVEAFGRVHWVPRAHYMRLVEISDMIERAIVAGADKSTIRHIFDESETIEAIRARFAFWQCGPNKKI